MATLTVNGINHEINGLDPATPLLWVLRDHLGLVGAKYGCGIGQCGACTVHLNDAPVRSCLLPLSGAAGQKITTIEGLASPTGELHPLQQAWIEHDVPQCGYCQAGQLMSAAALLKQKKKPTDADIENAMSGNICRCGTYLRIRAAIHSAASNGSKVAGGVGQWSPTDISQTYDLNQSDSTALASEA
jgi:aerobic-type carbon monoxide dehydrogenase small subunit (CoxS/CutS family)